MAIKRSSIITALALALAVGVSTATAGRATTAGPKLSEKNKAKLRAVLLHHVVRGKITAAQAKKLHSAKTLEGKSLSVRVQRGKVIVGGATVIKANVLASNGVIHVINKVLIP
jgi:uncharacterized surface protein with fasciclin (FAS1) repeats